MVATRTANEKSMTQIQQLRIAGCRLDVDGYRTVRRLTPWPMP
jgi:hypothetical protein